MVGRRPKPHSYALGRDLADKTSSYAYHQRLFPDLLNTLDILVRPVRAVPQTKSGHQIHSGDTAGLAPLTFKLERVASQKNFLI